MIERLYLELQKPFDAICYYNKTRKWGRLVDVIINLEPNDISLVDRVINILISGKPDYQAN